jgi:hypothetical protein
LTPEQKLKIHTARERLAALDMLPKPLKPPARAEYERLVEILRQWQHVAWGVPFLNRLTGL